MTEVATRDRVYNYLTAKYSLAEPVMNDWSDSLAGLPWNYVPPLIEMAVNGRTHPIVALGMTARVSKDGDFVAAARQHLQVKP